MSWKYANECVSVSYCDREVMWQPAIFGVYYTHAYTPSVLGTRHSFAVQSQWPHNSLWSLGRGKAQSLACGTHTQTHTMTSTLQVFLSAHVADRGNCPFTVLIRSLYQLLTMWWMFLPINYFQFSSTEYGHSMKEQMETHTHTHTLSIHLQSIQVTGSRTSRYDMTAISLCRSLLFCWSRNHIMYWWHESISLSFPHVSLTHKHIVASSPFPTLLITHHPPLMPYIRAAS